MSEYMTPDSIAILRGESTSDRGLLGQYVDRSERSGTLLFDEIEKAHPLIMDLYLQILSAARFTLATGETLDLSDYVVVTTTNVGSRILAESRSTDRETIVRRMIQAGASDFRVEIMGRFELQAVFNKLDYQSLQKVGELHTAKCLELINAQGHSITIDPGVVEYVQREGYSERFGARPMQNAAMRVLRNIVTAEMLRNGGMPVSGRIEYDRRSNKCLMVKQ
jgi:ATP-dependent Clp protease ATP-binding subunit ClpB